MNKKFLKISLVTALMAGVVALYSCKKEDNSAADGKKSAEELCDCLSNAENEDAWAACYSANENKYKQKYGFDEAFFSAFVQELRKCERVSAKLGKDAAEELCDCFSNATDLSGEQACWSELMTKYDGLFHNAQGQGGNPDFEDAFNNELGNCNNIPDWFVQIWTSGNE